MLPGHTVEPVAFDGQAVAAPMGNIDKLVVIDQGNGADGGSGGLGRIAKTSPAVVFSVLQQLEALGLNIPSVMQQLGINGTTPTPTENPPPAPPSPKART